MPFSDTIFKTENSATERSYAIWKLNSSGIQIPSAFILNFNLMIKFIFFRGLVRKYSQVIQRYYVQYLSGYDAIALDQAIQVKKAIKVNFD